MSEAEKKVPMTARGYEKLKMELINLKNQERPTVIQAISEARSHGDLSENAEYHAAKEKQSFIEGRIAELEVKLNQAQIIDVSFISGDVIKFGATVELVDNDSRDFMRYQIVGSDEADVKQGLLSITSPLARALIGKTAKEEVEVSIPGGTKSYLIEKIEYI